MGAGEENRFGGQIPLKQTPWDRCHGTTVQRITASRTKDWRDTAPNGMGFGTVYMEWECRRNYPWSSPRQEILRRILRNFLRNLWRDFVGRAQTPDCAARGVWRTVA